MTFRLDESVLGFGEGEMSFADPYLEPIQKTTRARIAVPRPDDFEMDPHCQWDDIKEEEDEEEKGDTHQNQDHLDAVAPPPLTNNSQLFTQLQLPSSPDVSHLTPRGRNPSATVASRSPTSRSTSTGSRQHRMEDIHGSRISSRRRHSTETESPKKQCNPDSLSPHHRLSRRHLVQGQRAQGQDWVASSNRRLSEPSRRNIRLAALELSGALASQQSSPTGSSRRSSDPPPVPLERAESSPASLKASHHRRTSSRASSRRNLTVSPRPEVQDLPPSHREAPSSRRKPLDRSSSDGQAEVRRSVAGTSSRILVTPSKSDTRAYNGTRKTVARSCSEGSKKIPIESGRHPDALLPIHNLSPPNRAKDHVTSHGSQSPSRSRRKTPRSQPPREESRIVERNARTRSRSKSRRTEGSSRRERRISSPSNGKDKPRSRSKSRDASSRRHNLRSSGGRIAKANDNGDAYKILQSMLVSQGAEANDNDNDNDHTWDSFEDQSGQNKNKFTSDPEGRETNTTGSDMDVSSPASSSLGDFLSLSSRRGSSPGLPLAGGPQSPYVLSNQATKERKEESKLRRSNIMKSLKDLLQFDAENLKVEVLEDGTKRLVVDLSDLNTVMEDFANHRK